MTKIEEYSFGFVVSKVNFLYELLETRQSNRIGFNIFGNPLVISDTTRIAWCRFMSGVALSQAYKNKCEAENFQKMYQDYYDSNQMAPIQKT